MEELADRVLITKEETKGKMTREQVRKRKKVLESSLGQGYVESNGRDKSIVIEAIKTNITVEKQFQEEMFRIQN